MASCFVEERELEITGQLESLVHSVNMPMLYVGKVVQFCKLLPEFELFSQDDQMTILNMIYFYTSKFIKHKTKNKY